MELLSQLVKALLLEFGHLGNQTSPRCVLHQDKHFAAFKNGNGQV